MSDIFKDLKNRAVKVKIEDKDSHNSAERIGQLMYDMIETDEAAINSLDRRTQDLQDAIDSIEGGGGESNPGYQKMYFANVTAGTVPSAPSAGDYTPPPVDAFNYDNGKTPTWSRTNVDDDTKDTYAIWVWFNGNDRIVNIDGPVRLDGGGSGTNGEDGEEIEWIYFRSQYELSPSDMLPIRTYLMGCKGDEPAKYWDGTQWVTQNVTFEHEDAVPLNGSWVDNAQGVEEDYKYEYAAYRRSRNDATTKKRTWGDDYFHGPLLWSAYGKQGTDGDGVEYIFYADHDGIINGAINHPENWDENTQGKWKDPEDHSKGRLVFQDNEFIAEGSDWMDEPIDLEDSDYGQGSVEFVSMRKKRDGVWQAYSEPKPWSRYGKDGVDGIVDGYTVDFVNENMPVNVDGEGNVTSYENKGWVQVVHNSTPIPYADSADSTHFTYTITSITCSDGRTPQSSDPSDTNYFNAEKNSTDKTQLDVTIKNAASFEGVNAYVLMTVTLPNNTTRKLECTLYGVVGADFVDLYVGCKAIKENGGTVIPSVLPVGVTIGRNTFTTWSQVNDAGYKLKYNYPNSTVASRREYHDWDGTLTLFSGETSIKVVMEKILGPNSYSFFDSETIPYISDGKDGISNVTIYKTSDNYGNNNEQPATPTGNQRPPEGWGLAPFGYRISNETRPSGIGAFTTVSDGQYKGWRKAQGSKQDSDGGELYRDRVDFTTYYDNQRIFIRLKADCENGSGYDTSPQEMFDYIVVGDVDTVYTENLTDVQAYFTEGVIAQRIQNGYAARGTTEKVVSLRIANAGNHYVYIYYAKDSDSYENSDSAYYKIDTPVWMSTAPFENGVITNPPGAWSIPTLWNPEGANGANGTNGTNGRDSIYYEIIPSMESFRIPAGQDSITFSTAQLPTASFYRTQGSTKVSTRMYSALFWRIGNTLTFIQGSAPSLGYSSTEIALKSNYTNNTLTVETAKDALVIQIYDGPYGTSGISNPLRAQKEILIVKDGNNGIDGSDGTDGKSAAYIHLRGTGYNIESPTMTTLCEICKEDNTKETITINQIGLTLIKINRTTLEKETPQTFNVYGDSVASGESACSSLAAAINNTSSDYFVCLISHDAVRWTQELIDALCACGSLGINDTTPYRVPFAFIGYRGLPQGQAVQAQSGQGNDDAPAEITVYVNEGAMSISKENTVGRLTKRFYYNAGEYIGGGTETYLVNENEAPYFSYNGEYWVFEPNVQTDTYYYQADMQYPSNSSSNWHKMFYNKQQFFASDVIFGKYAHLGSFIINGDWQMSTDGKVNGVALSNSSTIGGAVIGRSENSTFSVKGYTLFDEESPLGESDLLAQGSGTIASSTSVQVLDSSVPLNSFYTYCVSCTGHSNSASYPVKLRIRNDTYGSLEAITLNTGTDNFASAYFRVSDSGSYVVDLYQPTTGGGGEVSSWSIYRVKFAPNFAVDGFTGKTYQNDAHIKGVVEAVNGTFNGELTAGDIKVTRRQEPNYVWSGMYTPLFQDAVNIGVRNYNNSSYSGEIILLGSGVAGGYVSTYAGGDETGSKFELSYAKPTNPNRSRIVLASGNESGKASITVQTTVESGASASATVIEQDNVSTTNVDTSTIHVDTIYPKTTNGYVSIPSNIITGSGTKYLPSNPRKGMVIFVKGTTGSLTIDGNGKLIMGANGTNTDSSITIGNASFFFVYDGDRWIRYCCTE